MAILKAPPTPPKNETLQIRIAEEIKTNVTRYAAFINASESYVVSEALKLLFRKAAEFREWLENQFRNGEQIHNGVGLPFEIAKKFDVH